MLEGKPAGVRCVQLTMDNLCCLYGKPERPVICTSYQATEAFCGGNQSEALRLLEELESKTRRYEGFVIASYRNQSL